MCSSDTILKALTDAGIPEDKAGALSSKMSSKIKDKADKIINEEGKKAS